MANKDLKSLGKSFRTGVTLLALLEVFPDEKSATKWFEAQTWSDDRCCGHCGSVRTREVPKARPMPS